MNVLIRGAIYASVVLAPMALFVAKANSDVCVYKPPKVKRVCGAIVDPSGQPIPRVGVTLLKDGLAIKTVQTDQTGEFDLDLAQSGKYELDATAVGFQHVRYQLVLAKPTKPCKHALRIQMAVGGDHCDGDIRETNKPLKRKR